MFCLDSTDTMRCPGTNDNGTMLRLYMSLMGKALPSQIAVGAKMDHYLSHHKCSTCSQENDKIFISGPKYADTRYAYMTGQSFCKPPKDGNFTEHGVAPFNVADPTGNSARMVAEFPVGNLLWLDQSYNVAYSSDLSMIVVLIIPTVFITEHNGVFSEMH